MATVTSTLVFADAGETQASVDVAGFTGLTAASYLEAFTMAEASTDHSADEIIVDGIDLICAYLSATEVRVHGLARTGRVNGDYPIRVVSA